MHQPINAFAMAHAIFEIKKQEQSFVAMMEIVCNDGFSFKQIQLW